MQTLLEKAALLYEEAQYDSSYLTFEQAGKEALIVKRHLLYLRARAGMAKCTQFTTIANRSDIANLVEHAITLIEREDSLIQTPETAKLYYYLGRHQWAIQGDYNTAEKTFSKSISIAQDMGTEGRQQKMECYSDLVNVFANQERFDTAQSCAEMALQLSKDIFGDNHAENGQRLYRLGFLYYRKGHYPQAIKFIQEGIIQIKNNDGPELQVGLGYSNLSAVYVAMLDKKGTLESTAAAQQIFEKNLGPTHEAIANINWDLGSLHTDLEDYARGENHYRKAIEIFTLNFGSQFSQLPLLYHQLGFCLDQQGKYLQAEEWHNKGLVINEDRYGSAHPRTGNSYRQLADHYNMAGQYEQAGLMIDRGIPIISEPTNQSNVLRAWLYEEQGDMYLGTKKFDQAAQAYSVALEAICTGITSSDHTFNPLYYSDYQNKKASALFEDFKASRDTDKLEAALLAAQESHQGILKLRQNYHGSESKLFLQQRARDHYDLLLNILYELQDIKESSEYVALAWIISEEAKSLLLLEELKEADITFKDVPSSTLDSLENMRLDLAFYQQNIFFALDAGDSAGANNYKSEYFSLNTSMQTFEQALHEKYPQYASLQYDIHPSSLSLVQKGLPTNTALIEYYLADNHYYVFGVSNDEVVWNQFKTTDDFLHNIKSLFNEARNLEKVVNEPAAAISDYLEASTALYTSLFPPEIETILQDKDKIIIVPDQQLGYLSFESLSPDGITYLIENHAITYAYSGSMFLHQNSSSTRRTWDHFAGFAPSYEGVDSTNYEFDGDLAFLYREGMLDLPGARQEVRDIHSLLSGDLWLDSAATRSNFIKHAPSYQILHLSMHGLVAEDDPMRSRLLFHSGNADRGALYAYEVYNMDLQADMVVLSACNTASGLLQRGEGVLSLARAFAYAGVPNLIANLWRADDRASSQIMVNFYKSMAEGLTKDNALRQAKLSFLHEQKSETLKHPYFWSSQVLVGENTSHYSKGIAWYWWMLVIGILIVSALMLKNKIS